MKKLFIPLSLLLAIPFAHVRAMEESTIDFSQSIMQIELSEVKKNDITRFVNSAVTKELSQAQQIAILSYIESLKIIKLTPNFSIASIVFLAQAIEKLDSHIKSQKIPTLKIPQQTEISESVAIAQTLADLSLPEKAIEIIAKKQAENDFRIAELTKRTQEISDEQTENRIRIGLLKLEEERCRIAANVALEQAAQAEKERLLLEANSISESRIAEIKEESLYEATRASKNAAALQQKSDSIKKRQAQEAPSSCIIS